MSSDTVATLPGFAPGWHASHGCSFTQAAGTGANWPSANAAIYVPFRVTASTTVRRIWWGGSNTTGNVDVGIFNSSGTKLVSTGATANASGFNIVDVADTTLSAGAYWIGVSASSASSGIYRGTIGVVRLAAQGIKQEASAHPLPATATLTTATTYDYLPAVGYFTIASIP